ncbi:MAG: hypothetical protein GYB68_10825, partial [Chloroflexi bacterium]|nr:hypothetical protein [Chloroflexota bacterium]
MINIGWQDESQQLLVLEFMQNWTKDDLYEVAEIYRTMLPELDHDYCAAFHMHDGTVPPRVIAALP